MARARKAVLIVLFAVQATVAVVAYRDARVDGHAQPFGWQMFTGHTERPTFTIIRRAGEEAVPLLQVLYRYRSELTDELSFDHRVFEFVCGLHDDVSSVRVTSGARTRTVQCEGR